MTGDGGAKRGVSWWVVVALTCVCASGVWAQEGERTPMVSGQGTEVLRLAPDTMRMKVLLRVGGKTLEESVERYKGRSTVIKETLTKLGARADSVTVGPPSPSGEGMMGRQMREAMRMLREMREEGEAPEEEGPVHAGLDFTVEAEWPLAGETVEARMLEAARVEKAVRSADLIGKAEMSLEEKELLEEQAAALAEYGYSDDGSEPGKAAFAYVKTLTAEEMSRTLAKSYAQAKKRAEQLAGAAGHVAGRLVSLSSVAVPGQEDQDYRMYMAMSQFMGARLSGEQETEALGTSPAEVTLRVVVSAGFELRPAER